jgi:hypothetical protein
LILVIYLQNTFFFHEKKYAFFAETHVACVCVCVCGKCISSEKKILSQIHPTMNSALNTIFIYQNIITILRNSEDMPSAMPLAAMQGRVAADCL